MKLFVLLMVLMLLPACLPLAGFAEESPAPAEGMPGMPPGTDQATIREGQT